MLYLKKCWINLKKQHLVDKMGDMNIWQIWGEVYVNDWNLQNSAQERVQRERIFVELLPVASYVTGVCICR